MSHQVTVLGIGNILYQDEGVGVHAVEAFRKKHPERPGLTIEDGGTEGMKLLPIVEQSTHLIIVDAVVSSKEAGTVICLEKDRIPYFGGMRMSQHQQSFQEVLFLADIRGHLPDYIYFIGVVPKQVEWGLELTPAVTCRIPVILEHIESCLKRWGQ
ncbi:HyaD/HybD family hydrogenase maturation endopeptidase [Aneurinibacillus terranovensis]|uniref:HyaD/HybD family hydrogenase maturation endopeptidase n=1 Tax=Aneurinibacillus terranovensis TaxID=278991 RepID=UPI000417B086|nr:HyaD/HybD family hydrogenase maturation endopeptidase [Aneurinibacillus terranovensis]